MDAFFQPPVDPDDMEWRPWETQLLSEHVLTGTIEPTGEDAAIVINLCTWAATVEDAKRTGIILFDWLLKQGGVELT